MKRLMLLRHAKSDWNASYDSDHDRPLSKRGVRAATAIGRFMALTGLLPDYAVSSTAVRARRTLELAMDGGGWGCPANYTEALYGSGPHDVVRVIGELPSSAEHVLIVGHEPTWSGLAELLTGGSVRVVTGTLVGIEFDFADWRHVGLRSGRLTFTIPPRLLTDGSLELG